VRRNRRCPVDSKVRKVTITQGDDGYVLEGEALIPNRNPLVGGKKPEWDRFMRVASNKQELWVELHLLLDHDPPEGWEDIT
jgi:hypothetical protein